MIASAATAAAPLPAGPLAGRRRFAALLFAAALVGLAPLPAAAQSPRAPKNDAKFETPEFAAAVAAGTRTRTGVPGPKYWQHKALYSLEASINPVNKRLTGKGSIKYYNASPDTLASLFVHLNANLFEMDAKKNADATSLGGIVLNRVTADGLPVPAVLPKDRKTRPAYAVTGTVMELRLPTPLAPGAWVELGFDWVLRIQPDGAPRGGQDNEVWYLSYWYPQVAVHDDVYGWTADQYLGRGEFYMGYADYDVKVTVPAGWLVQATGTLQNADETLTPAVRERLALARTSDTVVHVVTAEQRGVGQATQGTAGGTLTWRFHADQVRDVAFGASPSYVWDAMAAPVGDANGDGTPDTTLAQAFYRPAMTRWFWNGAAPYIRGAIGTFSQALWPYPYPHLTAMEGPRSCGGMEFPMLTCIGERGDSIRTFTTFAHEIAHEWFPMQVGSDEKRNAWMDEGVAQYFEGVALAEWTKEKKGDFDENRNIYVGYVRRGGDEQPITRWADRFGNEAQYAIASYYKPVAVFLALKAVIGEDAFAKGFRQYGLAWRNRHPQPEDWFYAMEAAGEKDLRWFWQTWFEETSRLELEIDTVVVSGDSATVTLVNRGKAAMPVPVQVTRGDGSTELLTIGERVWADDRKYTFGIPAGGSPVRRIRIDPEKQFPYLDRSRLEWRK